MVVQQMDAISSFQHVVDNLPHWQKQISDLSVYAAERYEEYVADYSRLLHKAKARRKKSASIASLHSSDNDQQPPEQPQLEPPTSSELVDINPLEAGNRFIYTQAHRKRKPGTSMRSNASGPRTYRSKQMVVIYYDSHVQTELDRLVKGVGAARNNIRKGKTAYIASKGFVLPSLGRRYEAMDNLMPNPTSRSQPRLPKAKSDLHVVQSDDSPTGEAAFATCDKQLEAIQNLCETAAHQVIRDGDCKIELQDAAGKLDVLYAIAQSTLDLFKAEKQKVDKDEARSARSEVASDNTSTQSTLYEKSSTEAFGMSPKILAPLFHPAQPSMKSLMPGANFPAMGAIEVDDGVDDDDDDEDTSADLDLNITNYRTAGRRIIT